MAVQPLLLLLASAAERVTEKTFCEAPSKWEPTTPLEQLRLTLQWKSTANESPWWMASVAQQFSIRGAPVDGGQLCEFAKSLPPQIVPVARFLLCEDCSEGCDISCYPEKVLSYERCYISLNSNCVHLEGDIPADIEVMWARDVDPWRIALGVIGALLVSFSTPLSRSTTVHMTTGAFFGVSLGAIIIAWWTWRQAKSTIPFARYYLALINFMLVLAPSIGFYLFHTLTPSSTMALHAFHQFLVFQDPYFGVPIGFIAFLAFTSIGCYMGRRLFSCEDFFDDFNEKDHVEVKFQIGGSGQRVDAIPIGSNARVGLEWCMWMLGLIMMLRCSSMRVLNLGWIAFVMIFRTLRHWWNVIFMYRTQSLTPSSLNKKLLSSDDFLRQSKFSTEIELTKLRQHLKENGVKYFSAMGTQERELRLRRFCEGGSHVDSVPSLDWK